MPKTRIRSTTMEVYEDFGDIICQVYEDPDFEDSTCSASSLSFCSIKFNVTFTLVPSFEEDDDFNFLNDLDSLESGEEEHICLVKIDDLTSVDRESRWILADLLESIRVPPDQIVICDIKNCARKMASDEKNAKRSVIGMVVDLDILREAVVKI